MRLELRHVLLRAITIGIAVCLLAACLPGTCLTSASGDEKKEAAKKPPKKPAKEPAKKSAKKDGKKKGPEPFPESYTMNKTSFEVAVKGKDRGTIERAITALAKAASKTEREDVRKDALKLIRPHLKYTKAKEHVCLAAIKALGVLKLKYSSASLMALGEKRRSKRIPRLLRANAIYSIAKIQDKRSIEVVLDYLKSPRPDKTARYLAVAASRAVGLYATLPAKKKFWVMKEVMRAWADLFSAAGGYFMTSADAAEWWGETHAPLVDSFNKVLSRQVKNYKAAEHWWRKNRKKVQKGKW